MKVNVTIDSDTISDSSRVVRKGLRMYRFYNEKLDHYLEIKPCSDCTIISGSWRKWYHGADSFNDLNPYEILRICYEIAIFMGLDFEAILDGEFKLIELGFTFILPIYPSTILNSIFRYSNFELGRYDRSISFRGNDYWLGLYDKKEEINSQKKDWKIEDGNNYLRIEIKAFSNTALKSKLRGVKTLRDVIIKYRMLIISLFNEIKRVEMTPINLTTDNIKFTGRVRADLRRYLIYIAIQSKGARQSFELIDQLNVSKRVKTSIRNELRKAIKEYDKLSPYSHEDFINQVIKKQLAAKISVPIPNIAYSISR